MYVHTHKHTHIRIREGNENLLQYSGLGNPMDRGAWQAQSVGLQRVGPHWALTRSHTHVFKHVLCPLYSFFYFRDPILWIVVCLVLFRRSLKLSSCLFLFFSFFCSASVIPTTLSSSSLIHFCVSSDQLLVPSSVFKKFQCCILQRCLVLLYIFPAFVKLLSVFILSSLKFFKHVSKYYLKLFSG